VDVWIMLAMGVAGYLLRKLGFETAPVVLGLVLAPMLEMTLRQSLAMSDAHYAIFLARPIAAALLGIAGLILFLGLLPTLSRAMDWRQRLSLIEKGEA
jgi:putative tricarboxylic transport membrane protein